MAYKVAIRNNATREVRICDFPESDWEEHSDHLWTEGNFACDCNRYLFFQRAKDEDEVDCPCGMLAYTAIYAELPDGTHVPIDDEDVWLGHC